MAMFTLRVMLSFLTTRMLFNSRENTMSSTYLCSLRSLAGGILSGDAMSVLNCSAENMEVHIHRVFRCLSILEPPNLDHVSIKPQRLMLISFCVSDAKKYVLPNFGPTVESRDRAMKAESRLEFHASWNLREIPRVQGYSSWRLWGCDSCGVSSRMIKIVSGHWHDPGTLCCRWFSFRICKIPNEKLMHKYFDGSRCSNCRNLTARPF